MEKIDNSNLCWECTGDGCKVCNGTGIDPEYKPKPSKSEEIRISPSLLKIVTTKCEVPFIDGRIGKKDGSWYVFEYTTGRPINSEGRKTKKAAIEAAILRLNHYGPDKTKQAIESFPILNTAK
jgi:hypothetical protein